MEGLFCKFELYVQALFNTHFHLDRLVFLGLRARVLHHELFFFGDAVVVAIDDNIDVVPQSHDDSIV